MFGDLLRLRILEMGAVMGGAGEKEGSGLPEHCTPVLRICGSILGF